ncbi:MAG: FHA domain-containing protein [Chitinispirillaceae bacterium]|nr:FHA domain-containing protein [Chitinispirillaceae bacterium]
MAYLEIKEGPLAGTHLTLEGKITIGRHSGCILHLNDASVSRHHAEIWQKDTYFALVDLGSANGSFVNGEQLHRLVPRPLYDNDEIILGNSRLFFHAQGQQPPGNDHHSRQHTASTASPRTSNLSLSVVMTGDDHQPLVNATIDASRALLFDPSNDAPEQLLVTIQRLQAMVQIANDLGTVLKPDALAERIMSSIFDIFPHADRAFIMACDSTTQELKPLAARSRATTSECGEFPVSSTVLQTVIRERQSILLSDASSDERFAGQQSIVNLSIRSLMCAPFICKDELLGVIGVDTMSRQKAFSTDDLSMLTGIASQAAIAFKNVDLYSAVENETQIRTQLSRYLSRDVVEGIIGGTIPLRLGGEKKWGTILFCDIVGFTSIAENLSALDVVEKLNRYYSLVTEIITSNHGTLHKFGGDMIMAFWNVMVADDRACYNAVRCGLEMQNAIFYFGIQLENEGQRPLHLGIGCNTGEFAGGNIGGANRMEYTVIGDNVNLAQRIESLASRWQVLIAEETFDTVKNFCSAIRMQPVLVKGKIHPITVYSVRGMLLHDESMLLTIPLIIMTPEGTISGSGLATLCNTSEHDTELHIVSMATIPPWTTLLVQFDLPELSVAPRITGTISAAFRRTSEHKTAYTHIVLTELTGDAAAFMLLRAGACGESRKNWGDMKRH